MKERIQRWTIYFLFLLGKVMQPADTSRTDEATGPQVRLYNGLVVKQCRLRFRLSYWGVFDDRVH